MSWWQLVPTVLWAIALIFLPGYLVVRGWAVTGLVAVATAAPVSVGIVSATAVLGEMAGLRWNVLLVVVPAVVLAAIGIGLHKFAPSALGVRRRTFPPLRSRWTLLVYVGALLIPAVLLVRGLTTMIGGPQHISQTYDNIFHLNAIRYILESGSGSSLTLGGLHSDGADPSAYPAAWHDVVSLVVQLSGSSIPASVNAVTLVLGALAWPISCIFLATRVTGNQPIPVLFSGALSAVFGAFPYLMVDFGVLYPYFMSLALMPAALALVTMATGVGKRNGIPRRISTLMLIGAVAPGMALAHPSTALALLVFAVPVFVVGLVRYRRILSAGAGAALRYWGLVVLLLAYLALAVLLWTRLRPSEEASFWQPYQSISQAVGEVFSAGFIGQGPTWIVLLLTLTAVGLVMRRQFSAWVLGVYLVAAGLYIVVSGVDDGDFRDFVTGVWYNDSFRLAGQMPVITVVVCTVSATWIITRLLETLPARVPALSRLRSVPAATPASAALAFVAAIVLGVIGQYSSVNYAIAEGKQKYVADANAPVLSPAEQALLERVDEHVPEDATIIGNPWTGTALAYALAGRRTLTPHVGGTVPPDVLELMNDLDEIGADPRICSLINEFDSYYVLDFEGPQVNEGDVHYPGIQWAEYNPDLTLIDQEGPGARLYRVTGC